MAAILPFSPIIIIVIIISLFDMVSLGTLLAMTLLIYMVDFLVIWSLQSLGELWKFLMVKIKWY